MVSVPVIVCFGDMNFDFDLCMLYKLKWVVVFLIHWLKQAMVRVNWLESIAVDWHKTSKGRDTQTKTLPEMHK